jgi:DNA repair exonuclease SbcCD ATPase subunit
LSLTPHDEFLGLCALSTSGELTADEQERLQEHLAVCPSCGEAMKQYRAVIAKTIPALAPHPESFESDPTWSQEQAEALFFQRLKLEEKSGTDRAGAERNTSWTDPGGVPFSVSQATWRSLWTLYAAGILLFIALGISAYQVGVHPNTKTTAVAPIASQNDATALKQQVTDAGREREALRAQMAQRDHLIADLRRQLELQSAEISHRKISQDQLGSNLQNSQANMRALLEERSEVAQRLDAAQAKTQSLQDKLEALEHQSSQDKQRATAVEAKVSDLNRLLHDREATLEQQEELLAHDRDIRDLMGARDLYVAEVYDVERTGETKKPYGRVFYTKGKSLIFYAYDLDQQAGLKNASTFQAWGRRGPDWQQALNLGIFFVDNSSKKRWVLRFDDPKALAQIDAVFVTVEPNGGSQKPSKKPLLFAYLHIDANHP